MTITRATAQTNSDQVKNETTAGANTATRVGQLFRDLSDSVAFTVDLAAAIAAGITEAAVRSALAACTASIAVNTQKITGVVDPASAQDAATKNYVDTGDALGILKSGARAFTGNQDMGANKLTGLATATAGTDAANKSYVDTAATSEANLRTEAAALTAALAVNSQKISSLANGAAATDAAALGQMKAVLRWNGSSTLGNSTSARFLANNCSATAGAASDASEAVPNKRQMAGVAGKLTRVDFQLDTTLATADTTVTVRVNGVDTALTCTLAHGSTVSTGGTASVTVAATDFISIKTVTTGADATTSNPAVTVVLSAA